MNYPLTPLDWKRRAVKYYPTKTAVIDGEKQFTYLEFGERIDRLSAALTDAGIQKGDHVAVMLPNTHYMLECFYGICQTGAVMVPLNYRIQASDMEYIINHSDAKMLIVDAEFAASIQEIEANLSLEEIIIVSVPGYHSTLQGIDYDHFIAHVNPSVYSPVDIDENQLLTLNYTSGTTSNPKGVMLTHRANYMNAANFMFHLGVNHDDVYLHTLPMFHANGWGGIWAITAVGGVHVCLRKVVPSIILELFEQHQVSLLCGAPTVINMLVNDPKAQVTTITSKPRMGTAGSPPAAALIERAQKILGLNIMHVYGLTETAPFILYNEWKQDFNEKSADEQATIKARQGIELAFNGETKVISPSGQEVAWNGEELGEIVTRGNVVMKGYYKDKERTAEAIKDGWFHTGDLAVTHPDGYIEIRDRAKDMIISGGENISSTEVEGVLYKHPDILETAVIAVPDDKWGEVPMAVIVLKSAANVSEADIVTYCRDNMAHFKAPKIIEFVEELPKTATGKLQKFRLRRKYWNSEKRVN
ncbi:MULTISPECIES: long-chain-fatty-acid--CoA ligase [Virgibacillus]|uniref:Long-chain-fatty-acid--CoA ligase n=1 Tax=Virgibacillus massiliensis TaxID=1462526 RepID=A0A024Q885_9BACI|nr:MULTISPECIES: long-chain-fatty-acid--CoA ligase [Virgibacillus]EQB37766.1 O-succinylbenzoate-CoA ligase [Virgibacillus sp. CM-4]MYL40501.1 long-chain-fatty-acid--CoA ligase [Virgibacillus massiliensis]CDQ38709.1 Long-chain-fatty-acid--CoA ligase [Virgibacillus massiliensis]